MAKAEVAIVGAPDSLETKALLDTVQKPFRPSSITALTPVDVPGETTIPLLNYRTLRNAPKPSPVPIRSTCGGISVERNAKLFRWCSNDYEHHPLLALITAASRCCSLRLSRSQASLLVLPSNVM